ncbi:MAG: hypothetical protein K0U41_06760 [Gammaproteobacteria bacterium]|nr:hypothetical protein [Gammaproteobacteria bacterium]
MPIVAPWWMGNLVSDPELTPEYIISSAEKMLQDMRTNENHPYTAIEVLVWKRAIMLLHAQTDAGKILSDYLRKYSLLMNKDMEELTQEAYVLHSQKEI